MNEIVKAAWIADLRSGYYKKGKYQLREQGDFFDATGVLCEQAVREGIIAEPIFTPKRAEDAERSWSGYRYGDTGDSLGTGLPKQVVEWSGVSYRTGYKISMMGDKGMSFNKIATWIEENL